MHDMKNVSVDVMLTQMTSKKGIKIHNESAIASMYKEYTRPQKPHKVKNRGSLRVIILLKEKRRGKLKVRKCSDGRLQMCYIHK